MSMFIACTSIGTCPIVCAASTKSGMSPLSSPIVCKSCNVPVTLEPCAIAMSFVSCVTAF